ncbi:hypothetical protein DLB09_22395 [Salmonella enterica subsp. salamae]|nr:hypothetical protein [Salmonella enterica subsp. salamae]
MPLKFLPSNWRYTLVMCSCFIVILMILKSVFFVVDYRDLTLQQEERFKNTPISYAEYDKEKLTHRMVKFDERNNLISNKEASVAYSVINDYLSKVKYTCRTEFKTKEFLQCANKILGESFYYKSAGSVGEGYAHHHSDCDSNAYLLFDAAKIFGKKIEIVYAPRHAFISFVNEKNGLRFYWETTTNGNRGESADFTESLYRKTFNNFYYSPVEENTAEKNYPVLLLSHVDEKRQRIIFNSLDKSLLDNPFVLDYYYTQLEKENSLTQENINTLKHYLQKDISAIDRRLILSRYFLSKDDKDSVRYFMNQIDDKECKLSCMEVRKQISKEDYIYYNIMEEFSKLNVNVSLFYFKSFINDIMQWILMILVFFLGNIFLLTFNKKDDSLTQ